jgi:transposase
VGGLAWKVLVNRMSPDGRYYASFVVERETVPLPSCDREVGIDLGLNALVVTSDGESIRGWPSRSLMPAGPS